MEQLKRTSSKQINQSSSGRSKSGRPTTPNGQPTRTGQQELVQQSALIRHSATAGNGRPEVGAGEHSAVGRESEGWSQATSRVSSVGGSISLRGGKLGIGYKVQQSDAENRQFLKELAGSVLKGEGVGWLKVGRLRKLMENESYRDSLLGQLNRNRQIRLKPGQCIEDVRLSKPVWQAMLRVCLAIVGGLEHSYQHNKLSGMASAFGLLELAHTHFYERPEADSKQQRPLAAAKPSDRRSSSQQLNGSLESLACISGESVCGPGVEQVRRSSELDALGAPEDSLAPAGDQAEVPSASTWLRPRRRSSHSLASSGEPDESFAGRARAQMGLVSRWRPGGSQWAGASSGQGEQARQPAELGHTLRRVYLFEELVQREQRNSLWDQMEFWEEAFLDVVSHERCLSGLDQGTEEMLERYKLLQEIDRKRLEHEEDRLLSTLLYNMVAFMLMLQVDTMMIKQKIRRLLGKCHIGLLNSAEINRLLEQIDQMKMDRAAGGDKIKLKPMASRQQQRHTFMLHRGSDPSGQIVLMEVNDEGLVLRSLDGSAVERWWYERLINMTYSPRNKIVCFWRKSAGRTVLEKFYTRKSHELYACIKDSMQNAAAQRGSERAATELGGEFPILDLKSGEGGILQVCMEGVGLLFASKKVRNYSG